MKYLMMLMFPLALIITVVGCEDDEEATPAVDCAALATSYSTAMETFGTAMGTGDATVEQCQAAMDGIAALIDGACAGYTLEAMDLTQAGLDSAKDGTLCAEMFP